MEVWPLHFFPTYPQRPSQIKGGKTRNTVALGADPMAQLKGHVKQVSSLELVEPPYADAIEPFVFLHSGIVTHEKLQIIDCRTHSFHRCSDMFISFVRKATQVSIDRVYQLLAEHIDD
jgi:hypothetical protein